MSKSEQARIGEAIAELTKQLEAWGDDDPAARADVIIKDLIRVGWRPRGPEAWKPTLNGDARPADTSTYTDDARAQIRAAQAAAHAAEASENA
jgi:hypothetical protein